MIRYPLNHPTTPPIPAKSTTALLLIDNQLGFRNLSAFGDGTISNPSFEKNITVLLEKFRKTIASAPDGDRPTIIHVQHPSVWSDSPLHPSQSGPYGPQGEIKRGVDFFEFAAPMVTDLDGSIRYIHSFDEPPPPQSKEEANIREQEIKSRPRRDEVLMTKHGHSVFINTSLENLLKERKIKTLVVAGMELGWSVSTAIRMAQNLALVGKWGGKGNLEDTPYGELHTDGTGVYCEATEDMEEIKKGELTVDMPRILLVDDATRAFGKGGIDAEIVHKVHVESLRDFAEVRKTEDVVAALQ